MTECERIVKKGIISEEFLKEETLCDFLVTQQRKKLWMISLDMLLEFDRVCKKHNIKYFLMGGTLLGAIRHKGFVPWDDDTDVMMLREDYEKFKTLEYEFKQPYFLQTPQNDPGNLYSTVRIRNSNTTMLVDLFKYEKFNQGIWLSVFPIDNWDIKGGEERRARIEELLKDNSTYMRMSNPNLSEADKIRVQNYSGRNPLEVNDEIHQIAMRDINRHTGYVALAVTTVYPLKNLIYRSEIFADTVDVDFEGFKFPAPVGYDEYLKTAYGNYMEFPPVEKRGNWHVGFFIDPDRPYIDYLKDNNSKKQVILV